MDEETKIPSLEVSDAIVESGGQTLYWCMQCGLCTGSCPWRMVPGEIAEAFNVRKVNRLGQLGLEGIESEDVIYACTTCGQCLVRCPRDVKVPEIIRGMRRMLAEIGTIAPTFKPIIGSLRDQGNPWSSERAQRTDWMKGIEVPAYTEQTEYLLFVCCTSCYDARSKRIARSLVELLKKAEVSFGVIGEEESCCGESIRKVGAEEVFTGLAESNIKLFSERGVKKIITTSPHCLYSFKHEYPELGGEFEVIHFTQLLAQLVREGKLKPKKLGQKIAYHDPCYLGRHGDIFDDPREILKHVMEDELIELELERVDSLCCGGGGGRIWMETKAGERFGDIRVEDALSKGAEVVATACPYCVIMLEASVLGLNKEEQLKIMDISEVVLEAFE